MLTHFYFNGRQEDVELALRGNTEGWPTDKMLDLRKHLKFDDDLGSSFWELTGRVNRLPDYLVGVGIEQVVLKHMMFLNDPSVALQMGPRSSEGAKAWVERRTPGNQNIEAGNLQEVTVWAAGPASNNQRLLDKANDMLDAIFAELEPAPTLAAPIQIWPWNEAPQELRRHSNSGSELHVMLLHQKDGFLAAADACTVAESLAAGPGASVYKVAENVGYDGVLHTLFIFERG